MIRKGYHTQEHRTKSLIEPIQCLKGNAWLGAAYYFWIEEDDALFWGDVAKRSTGKYDVYCCEIDCENILDTVFNEEHYSFWLKNIEKVAKKFVKSTGSKPTIKEINEYFLENKVWESLDGIMFQDISKNAVHFIVKEFQYKKRIQIALYNKDKLTKFAHHFTGDCN